MHAARNVGADGRSVRRTSDDRGRRWPSCQWPSAGFLSLIVIARAASPVPASDLDEFKVKRESVFEFAQKPVISRKGDQVEVRFETKSFCDVTVAIEEAGARDQGPATESKIQNPKSKIVRHLASGVLGPNAPEPFQRNSKLQVIVWDGKNEKGEYVDDKEGLTVRVSLGLRPQFERTLFWSPYKRHATGVQPLALTEEGVLMYEGVGHDHVILYDHDGNYLRTVYPFPANKVNEAKGLQWQTAPQDGQRLPLKLGFVQASLLTCGTSHLLGIPYKMGGGYAAMNIAARGPRLALLRDSLNRLATDGTTGGLDLAGPQVGFHVKSSGYGGFGEGDNIVGPHSAVFTADGKHLYLTGYMWYEMYHRQNNAYHGVYKLAFEGNAPPQVFVGDMRMNAGAGTDNQHFRVPTSVDLDSKGRVYVSDFLNQRIQVYEPDATFVTSIPTRLPAKVLVHPKTGEMWVFSFPVYGASPELMRASGQDFEWTRLPCTLTRYGPVENPVQIGKTQALPVSFDSPGFFLSEPQVSVVVDWHAPAPRVWVAARKYSLGRIDAAWGGIWTMSRRDTDPWANAGIRILEEKDGAWIVKRSFGEEAAKTVVRLHPPDFSRQRLYAHPTNHKLYLAEDNGFGKSFLEMLEIDPETGKIRKVDLPFDTEDITFDYDGNIYLRTDTLVVKYNFQTMQEIPWDYGEEHTNVGFSTISASRRTDVRSGLATPGVRPVCWNQGGMHVNPFGSLVAACASSASREPRSWMDRYQRPPLKQEYTPTLFPGRIRWGEVHMWDGTGRHARLDVVPGVQILNDVKIDRKGDLYLLTAKGRVLDGQPYFNEMAGCLVKVTPGATRVLTSSPRAEVPLPEGEQPSRTQDLAGFWFQKPDGERGAHWLYGGVGWGGFNPSHSGGGCACWNARFDLDYFARSFAPEIDHYSVAILDSNGNLITRVGRYGNADDGVPLIKAGGPEQPRSLGADEVGLFHAAFTATDTDRRLFIADAGNGRVLSVLLGYHASECVPLAGVLDEGKVK
jgi:hypothetical protein